MLPGSGVLCESAAPEDQSLDWHDKTRLQHCQEILLRNPKILLAGGVKSSFRKCWVMFKSD